MAVAVELDFEGATLAQYDEINEMIGLLPGGPPSAPEELFHWVRATDNGFRVIDVWETRAAFERFVRERLEPVLREAGLAGPTAVRFFEVHNYFGGNWRRGRPQGGE
jgi:hypothetical protein